MDRPLVRADTYTVEVRDINLQRRGLIRPADIIDLAIVPRHNNVGTLTLQLPRKSRLATTLATPGAGIIVTDTNGVVTSGPVTGITRKRSIANPSGLVTFTGIDDNHVLADALAYPTPTTADVSAQANDYDTRTGPAETIMRAYVNANIGPGAPSARRNTRLTLAADEGRGIPLRYPARFDNLGELLNKLATLAGLGFRVVQIGTSLEFQVYEVTDRTDRVRLSVDSGTLDSEEVRIAPPQVTRAIVAGQGQGADRLFVERTSTDALAAEATWGRRIEVFKDQRNASEVADLEQAGDEELANGAAVTTAIKATPVDATTMRYGRDWGLGDRVGVIVDGQPTASTVTAAIIKVNKDGVRIGAAIGDVTGFDADAALGARQAKTDARVSALERTAEGGGGTIQVMTPIGAPIPWPVAGTIPAGFTEYDGGVESQTAKPALFAVLGTAYNTGGEGAGNFRKPDWRGVVPAGYKPGDPVFGAAIGTKIGAATHTLTLAETPNAPINIKAYVGDANDYLGGSANAYGVASPWSAGGSQYNIAQTGGGDQPHNNVQPTVIARWIARFEDVTTAPAGSTASIAATPATVALRDADGRFQATSPSVAADVDTMGARDTAITAAVTARVCRLTKSSAQSTHATPGTPVDVTWNADTFATGMWTAGQSARIYPNKAGKWRVKAHIRGVAGADNASMFIQTCLNGADNSPSEDLTANGTAGGYLKAEDVFNVTTPGTDYFTVKARALAGSQAITPANCLFIAEYIGP